MNMRHWVRFTVLAGVGAVFAGAAFGAAYIHEFPHPAAVVVFHPRGDVPFTLAQLKEALEAGVRGVELDLRWRAADHAVVCSHEKRGIARRPTLEEALDAIERFHGHSATVRDDGLQFFLVLDLKDESPAFHRALVRVLAARAKHFANAARPDAKARGITVVISGFRSALERSIPAATLDTLCVIEGRDYTRRVLDLSGRRGGRFQWLALDYPVDRSRVRDLHAGRDPRARGRFNVRVVGARGRVDRALDSSADAVNADLDEIPAAVRRARRR
jgi:hypothetical protein